MSIFDREPSDSLTPAPASSTPPRELPWFEDPDNSALGLSPDDASFFDSSLSSASAKGVAREEMYNILGKPMTRAQLEQSDYGKQFLAIQDADKQGTRGFGEAVTDFSTQDIPFVGDVWSVKDIRDIVSIGRKLKNNEDMTDDERVKFAAYWADEQRKSAQGTSGMVGDIIRQLSGFAVEISAYGAVGGAIGLAGGPLAPITTPTGAGVGLLGGILRKAAIAIPKKIASSAAERAAAKGVKSFLETTGGAVFKKYAKDVLEHGSDMLAKGLAISAEDLLVNAAANAAGGNPLLDSVAAEQNRLGGVLSGDEQSDAALYMMGIGDRTIEYISEMSGDWLGHLLPVGKGMRKLAGAEFLAPAAGYVERKKADMEKIWGKLTSKQRLAAANGLSAWALSAVNNIDLDFAYDALKRIGYHGVVEEMGEERFGDFLRGMLGIQGDNAGLANAFDQMIPSFDQLKAEAIGFAIPGVAVTAIHRAKLSQALGGPGATEYWKSLQKAKRYHIQTGANAGVEFDGTDFVKPPEADPTVTARDVSEGVGIIGRATGETREPGFLGSVAHGLLTVVESIATGSFSMHPGIREFDAYLVEQGMGKYLGEWRAVRAQYLESKGKDLKSATPEFIEEASKAADVAIQASVAAMEKRLLWGQDELQAAADAVQAELPEGEKPTPVQIAQELTRRTQGPNATLVRMDGENQHTIWVRKELVDPENQPRTAVQRAADRLMSRLTTAENIVHLTNESTSETVSEQLDRSAISVTRDDLESAIANPYTLSNLRLLQKLNVNLGSIESVRQFREEATRLIADQAATVMRMFVSVDADSKGTVMVQTSSTDPSKFQIVPQITSDARLADPRLDLARNYDSYEEAQAALLALNYRADNSFKSPVITILPHTKIAASTPEMLASFFRSEDLQWVKPAYDSAKTPEENAEVARASARNHIEKKLLARPGNEVGLEKGSWYVTLGARNNSSQIYLSLGNLSTMRKSFLEDYLENGDIRNRAIRSHLDNTVSANLLPMAGSYARNLKNVLTGIAAGVDKRKASAARDLLAQLSRVKDNNDDSNTPTELFSKLVLLHAFGYDLSGVRAETALETSIRELLPELTSSDGFAPFMQEYLSGHGFYNGATGAVNEERMRTYLPVDIKGDKLAPLLARWRSLSKGGAQEIKEAQARKARAQVKVAGDKARKALAGPAQLALDEYVASTERSKEFRAAHENYRRAPLAQRDKFMEDIGDEGIRFLALQRDVLEAANSQLENAAGLSEEDLKALLSNLPPETGAGTVEPGATGVPGPVQLAVLTADDMDFTPPAPDIADPFIGADFGADEPEAGAGPSVFKTKGVPSPEGSATGNALVRSEELMELRTSLGLAGMYHYRRINGTDPLKEDGTPDWDHVFSDDGLEKILVDQIGLFRDLDAARRFRDHLFAEQEKLMVKRGETADIDNPVLTDATAGEILENAIQEVEDVGKEASYSDAQGKLASMLLEDPTVRFMRWTLGPIYGSANAIPQAQATMAQLGMINPAAPGTTDLGRIGLGSDVSARNWTRKAISAATNADQRNVLVALMYLQKMAVSKAGPTKFDEEGEPVEEYVFKYDGYVRLRKLMATLEVLVQRDGYNVVLPAVTGAEGETGFKLISARVTPDYNLGLYRVRKAIRNNLARVSATPATIQAFKAALDKALDNLHATARSAGQGEDRTGVIQAIKGVYSVLTGGQAGLLDWLDPAWVNRDALDRNSVQYLVDNIFLRLRPEKARLRSVVDSAFTLQGQLFRKAFLQVVRPLAANSRVKMLEGANTSSRDTHKQNPLSELWMKFQTAVQPPYGTIRTLDGKSISAQDTHNVLDEIVSDINKAEPRPDRQWEVIMLGSVTASADPDADESMSRTIDAATMTSRQQHELMRRSFDNAVNSPIDSKGRFIYIPPRGDRETSLAVSVPAGEVRGMSYEQAFRHVATKFLTAYSHGANLKPSTLMKRIRLIDSGGTRLQWGMDGGFGRTQRVFVFDTPEDRKIETDGALVFVGSARRKAALGLGNDEARIMKAHYQIVDADGNFTIVKVKSDLDPDLVDDQEEAIHKDFERQGYDAVTDINGAKHFSRKKRVTVKVAGVEMSGWEIELLTGNWAITTQLEHGIRLEDRHVSSPVISDSLNLEGSQTGPEHIANAERVAEHPENYTPEQIIELLHPERDRHIISLLQAGVAPGNPVIGNTLQSTFATKIRSALRMRTRANYSILRTALSFWHPGFDNARGKWLQGYRPSEDGSHTLPAGIFKNVDDPAMRRLVILENGASERDILEHMHTYETLKYANGNKPTVRDIADLQRYFDTYLRPHLRTIRGHRLDWRVSFADLFDRPGDNPATWTLRTWEMFNSPIDGRRVIPGSLTIDDRNPGGHNHAHTLCRLVDFATVNPDRRTRPGKSNAIMMPDTIKRDKGTDLDGDAETGRTLAINPKTGLPYTDVDADEEEVGSSRWHRVRELAAANRLIDNHYSILTSTPGALDSKIDKDLLNPMIVTREDASGAVREMTLGEAADLDKADDSNIATGDAIQKFGDPAFDEQYRHRVLSTVTGRADLVSLLRSFQLVMRNKYIGVAPIRLADGTVMERPASDSAERKASDEVLHNTLQNLVNLVIDADPRLVYLNINRESLGMLAIWLSMRDLRAPGAVLKAFADWKAFADSPEVREVIKFSETNPWADRDAMRSRFSDPKYAPVVSLSVAASELKGLGSAVILPYKRPDSLVDLLNARRYFEQASTGKFTMLTGAMDYTNPRNSTFAGIFQPAFDAYREQAFGISGNPANRILERILDYTGFGLLSKTKKQRLAASIVNTAVAEVLLGRMVGPSGRPNPVLVAFLRGYFGSFIPASELPAQYRYDRSDASGGKYRSALQERESSEKNAKIFRNPGSHRDVVNAIAGIGLRLLADLQARYANPEYQRVDEEMKNGAVRHVNVLGMPYMELLEQLFIYRPTDFSKPYSVAASGRPENRTPEVKAEIRRSINDLVRYLKLNPLYLYPQAAASTFSDTENSYNLHIVDGANPDRIIPVRTQFPGETSPSLTPTRISVNDMPFFLNALALSIVMQDALYEHSLPARSSALFQLPDDYVADVLNAAMTRLQQQADSLDASALANKYLYEKPLKRQAAGGTTTETVPVKMIRDVALSPEELSRIMGSQIETESPITAQPASVKTEAPGQPAAPAATATPSTTLTPPASTTTPAAAHQIQIPIRAGVKYSDTLSDEERMIRRDRLQAFDSEFTVRPVVNAAADRYEWTVDGVTESAVRTNDFLKSIGLGYGASGMSLEDLDKASVRGTAIHVVPQQIVNDEIGIPESLVPLFTELRKRGLILLAAERSFVSDAIPRMLGQKNTFLGGTIDLLAYSPADKSYKVLDFKTMARNPHEGSWYAERSVQGSDGTMISKEIIHAGQLMAYLIPLGERRLVSNNTAAFHQQAAIIPMTADVSRPEAYSSSGSPSHILLQPDKAAFSAAVGKLRAAYEKTRTQGGATNALVSDFLSGQPFEGRAHEARSERAFWNMARGKHARMMRTIGRESYGHVNWTNLIPETGWSLFKKNDRDDGAARNRYAEHWQPVIDSIRYEPSREEAVRLMDKADMAGALRSKVLGLIRNRLTDEELNYAMRPKPVRLESDETQRLIDESAFGDDNDTSNALVSSEDVMRSDADAMVGRALAGIPKTDPRYQARMAQLSAKWKPTLDRLNRAYKEQSLEQAASALQAGLAANDLDLPLAETLWLKAQKEIPATEDEREFLRHTVFSSAPFLKKRYGFLGNNDAQLAPLLAQEGPVWTGTRSFNNALVSSQIAYYDTIAPWLRLGSPGVAAILEREMKWSQELSGSSRRWYNELMQYWGMFSQDGRIHKLDEVVFKFDEHGRGILDPSKYIRLHKASHHVWLRFRYGGKFTKEEINTILLAMVAAKVEMEPIGTNGVSGYLTSGKLRGRVRISLPITESRLDDEDPAHPKAKLTDVLPRALAEKMVARYNEIMGADKTLTKEKIQALEAAGLVDYIEPRTAEGGRVRVPFSKQAPTDIAAVDKAIWTVPTQWVEEYLNTSSAKAKLVSMKRDAARISVRQLARESHEEFKRVRAEVMEHAPNIYGMSYGNMSQTDSMPHKYGMGFIGNNEDLIEKQRNRSMADVRKERVESLEKSLKKETAKGGKRQLGLDDVTHKMFRYLFELHNMADPGSVEAAIKEIKAGRLEHVGLTGASTYADVAYAIYTRGLEVDTERRLNRKRVDLAFERDDKVDLIELLKTTGRMVARFGNREYSDRLRNTWKTRGTTYDTAYRKEGWLPDNTGSVDAVRKYVDDVVSQLAKEHMLNQMALMTDPDGTPLVVLEPVGRYEGLEGVIKDTVWAEHAKLLSNYFKIPYDGSKSPKENIQQVVNQVVKKSKRYDAVQSSYLSIATYYGLVREPGQENFMDMVASGFRGGEVSNYLRHVDGTHWSDPAGIFDFLHNLNQWMKILALQASFFFPVAAVESMVAAKGVLATFGRSNPTKNSMSFWTLRQMMRANHPYVRSLMAMSERHGGEFSYSGNPMDAPVHVVPQHIEKAARQAELLFNSPRPASAVRQTGALLTSGSEFIFEDIFNVSKLWFIHKMILQERELAAKQGPEALAAYDEEETVKRWSDLANHSMGGQPTYKYSWLTPTVRRFLGLLMFSWNWSLSAWNIAGGGILTSKILKNYLAPHELNFIMTRNWPRMLVYVMYAVPMMLQAGVYAALAGAGGGGGGGDDDDNPLNKDADTDSPWIWKNEPGRKMYADITPLMRHSPFYRGDPTGHRRVYVHWGKQGFEILGWLTDPAATMTGKTSQLARTIIEEATGESAGMGWDLGFKGMGLYGLLADKEGEFSGSRLAHIGEKFAPFSVLAMIQNPDAFPWMFASPVSKGIGFNKACDAYITLLKAWAEKDTYSKVYSDKRLQLNLEKLGNDVLTAAERNGYEKDKIIDASRAAVLKEYYARVYKAIDRNDTAALEDAAKSIMRLNGVLRGVMTSVKSRNKLYGKPGPLTPEQRAMLMEAFKNP